MATRKGSSKRPQRQHKQSKKSRHDKLVRLKRRKYVSPKNSRGQSTADRYDANYGLGVTGCHGSVNRVSAHDHCSGDTAGGRSAYRECLVLRLPDQHRSDVSKVGARQSNFDGTG